MDLNVLKTFITVCEYGGFSAAGEKLGYSQSTVSSQIKQLENELGTTLFDRAHHNTRITSEGATVLEYAREMLQLNQKLLDTLRKPEEITGEIRLAMADSVCLRFFTDDYLAFHRKYPGISLKITSAGTEQMFNMLRKNEVDLVFTLDAHIYDSRYIICGESVESTHFVTSVTHHLAREKHLKLEDLIKEPFLLTEPDMSYRKMLDARLSALSLEIKPVMELGNPNQICSILKNCHAISFLPDYVSMPYIKEGSLVYLPVENCDISVWNQILINKNKWRSRAIDAFIEFYGQVIKN